MKNGTKGRKYIKDIEAMKLKGNIIEEYNNALSSIFFFAYILYVKIEPIPPPSIAKDITIKTNPWDNIVENNLVRSVSYTKSDMVVKNIDKYIKTPFSDLLLVVFDNLPSNNFNYALIISFSYGEFMNFELDI